MTSKFRLLLASILAAFVAACATPPPEPPPRDRVGHLDPQGLIDPKLLREAVEAYRKHYNKLPIGPVEGRTTGGHAIPLMVYPFRTDKFVVVDYRLPTTAKRLFIVDWKTGAVQAEYVTHGRGSASETSHYPTRFTNIPGSGTSSVGAFIGGQEYDSARYGRALRLAGLDPTNSNALGRAIVIHENETYFDDDRRYLGRSCGCFITDGDVNPVLIDVMKNGGFLYAGPVSLFDTKTAHVTRECNPHCGGACDVAGAGRETEDVAAAPPPAAPARAAPDVPQPKPAEVRSISAPANPAPATAASAPAGPATALQ